MSITREETQYAGQNTLGRGTYTADKKVHSKGQANLASGDLARHFKTRAEAFKFARSKGAGGFVYNGNSYTTRDAKETVSTWKKTMDNIRGKNNLGKDWKVGRSGIYVNSKYRASTKGQLDSKSDRQEAAKAYRNPTKVKTYAKVDNSRKKHEYVPADYRSAYDPNLFANFVGMFSPTNQIGAITRAAEGEGEGVNFFQRYADNLGLLKNSENSLQNHGLASAFGLDQAAEEHPYINGAVNIAGDVLSGNVVGGIEKGVSSAGRYAVRRAAQKAGARVVQEGTDIVKGTLKTPRSTEYPGLTYVAREPKVESVQWYRPDGTLSAEQPFMNGSRPVYQQAAGPSFQSNYFYPTGAPQFTYQFNK